MVAVRINANDFEIVAKVIASVDAQIETDSSVFGLGPIDNDGMRVVEVHDDHLGRFMTAVMMYIGITPQPCFSMIKRLEEFFDVQKV